MALDRFVVYYKIGDKQTAPGKEYLGVKDGDPVCFVDEAEWGRPLEEILYHGGNPFFAVVQHDRRMKPFFQSVLQGTGDASGTVDKLTYRPRTHRLPVATLAQLTGVPNLEANLRAKDYNVQLINGLTIGEQAFVDASAISNAPRVIDINATTAGDVDVGAGAVLTTFALAYVDLGNLTAALTFGEISDITETAQALITENLGGFAFRTTSRVSHRGNTLVGYQLTLGYNAYGFFCQAQGAGTFDIDHLRIVRTVAANAGDKAQIVTFSIAAVAFNIHHNIFDGGNLQGNGIRSTDADPVMSVYDNLIFDYNDAALTLDAADGNAASVYENNTFYSCGVGIEMNNNAGTVRRNASYANGTDFANTGAATLADNAASDLTGGGKTSGVAAVDFESVAAADRGEFLQPVRTGVLAATNTTRLAANTTDIAGQRWDKDGDWIGAKAARNAGGKFFFFNPVYR